MEEQNMKRMCIIDPQYPEDRTLERTFSTYFPGLDSIFFYKKIVYLTSPYDRGIDPYVDVSVIVAQTISDIAEAIIFRERSGCNFKVVLWGERPESLDDSPELLTQIDCILPYGDVTGLKKFLQGEPREEDFVERYSTLMWYILIGGTFVSLALLIMHFTFYEMHEYIRNLCFIFPVLMFITIIIWSNGGTVLTGGESDWFDYEDY